MTDEEITAASLMKVATDALEVRDDVASAVITNTGETGEYEPSYAIVTTQGGVRYHLRVLRLHDEQE